jgi:hypothetical protein
MIVCCDLYD